LDEILGAPALLKAESAAAYSALYDQVRSVLMPQDVIDELWVREYVELTWEGLRLRRLKIKLYTVGRPAAIQAALEPMFDHDRKEPVQLSAAWSRRGRGAKRVDRLLARAGYDEEAINALTLAERMDDFERVEQLLAHNERRRAAVLQDLERRRDSLPIRRLRATDVIEDAQIATGPAT
jgi:hypothetical protein